MDEPSAPGRSPRLLALLAGFAALYVVWGSTYLGIKFAVETLPPFLMAGWRFLLAGLILFAWKKARGAAWPTLRQWKLALVTGALLLLGGNGLVTWGQQTVPSGRAALFIATTPMWMVVLGWLFYAGERPSWRVVGGVLLGFGGAVLLIRSPGPNAAAGSLLGYLAILVAPVVWALGSHQTRQAKLADDPLLGRALQMIAGGGLMLLAGTCLGEWGSLATRTVSPRSMLAFAYLVVVGALVGFTTYAWLLRVASPTAVATYAYVNPLVAVLLAWLFTDEGLQPVVAVAASLIVGAVVLITLPKARAASALSEAPSPPAALPQERGGRRKAGNWSRVPAVEPLVGKAS
jgi:drug/metabolite transporter (DMT)-like permease